MASSNLAGAAANSARGAVSLGNAITSAGRRAQQNNIVGLSNQVANQVSAEGRRVFEESRLATQTGVLSNSISDATLEFQEMQHSRMQQVTDSEGNPTFDRLPDDIRGIGDEVLNKYASKISDPKIRAKFSNDFKRYTTNQQILSLDKARKQQLSYGRSSLQKGLGSLLQQGSSDSIDNVGSYELQGLGLIDDALAGGVISFEEHAAQRSEFSTVLRESAMDNVIEQDPFKAKSILDHTSAAALGVSDETKTRLDKTLHAKVTSDQIQEMRQLEMAKQSEQDTQAVIKEEVEKRIEAGAIRENELLKIENKLPQATFNQLKGKFVIEARRRQKELKQFGEISASISSGEDMSKYGPKLIDSHFNRLVDSQRQQKGSVTLEDKAHIASAYNTKVRSFAKELDGILLKGTEEQMLEAATAYSYLQDRGSKALEGGAFSKKAETMAGSINFLINKGGLSPEQAIAASREAVLNSDDNLIAARKQEFNKLKDFRSDNLKDTVADALDIESVFGLNLGFGFNKDVDDTVATTFKGLTEEFYGLWGDESIAMELAKAQMDKTHGTTNINGDDSYMFAPPEKLFGKDVDSAQLREEMLLEVQPMIGDMPVDSIKVLGDELTRSAMVKTSGGNVPVISYSVNREVKYTTPSGEEKSILIPVEDPKTGQAMRWIPSPAKSQSDAMTQTIQQEEVKKNEIRQNELDKAEGKIPGEDKRIQIDNISKKYPKASKEIIGTIAKAADEVGVPAEDMAAIANIESRFNPTIKAAASSATGLFQFIDSTWRATVKKHGAKHGVKIGDRKDARANALMGAELYKDNKKALEASIGRTAEVQDVYLAHVVGAGKAKRLLSRPDANINTILTAREIRNNPSLFKNGDTVEDVRTRLVSKLGR